MSIHGIISLKEAVMKMLNIQQTITEIENLIIDETKRAKRPLTKSNFQVIHQPANSFPKSLPEGKMAVYCFFYTSNNECLKVGQANLKSKARYQSHHYYIDSGKSTLTRSLINDSNMPMVTSNNWNGWVKANCERFDVLLDASLGKITLNFIEGLLQYHFKPRYEW